MLDTLKALSADGIFVQLPKDGSLPRSLNGRVMAGRHLLRMIAFAVGELEEWQVELSIAHELMSRARQRTRVLNERIVLMGRSGRSRQSAQKRYEHAELLFLAVMDAQPVGSYSFSL